MIALDTNILVYAEATDDPSERHIAARPLILRLGPTGAIVPLQVLAEFLNVCRRKGLLARDDAIRRASGYIEIFQTPETAASDIINAALLTDRYKLAYFDALICAIARRAGAAAILSEDMADGMDIDGLRIVNPFAPANAELLDDLFGG